MNRRLWTRWVVASTLGGLVFASFVRLVSLAAGGAVGEAAGAVAAEAVVGALALGGIMLGIATGQWVVIRRHVVWAGPLWLSTSAGGALGGGAAFGILAWLTEGAGPGAAVAAAVVVGLAAFGAVQWLGLRRRISGPGRYAATGMAGLVAAVLVTAITGMLLGDLAGTGVGGGFFGAAYGAVTGRMPAAAHSSNA